MKFNFDLNVPFKPFEQLMGVMPELSASLLPVPYRVRTTSYLVTMHSILTLVM
jgi:5'-3' exonuclease